jgi:hypothetical protein
MVQMGAATILSSSWYVNGPVCSTTPARKALAEFVVRRASAGQCPVVQGDQVCGGMVIGVRGGVVRILT